MALDPTVVGAQTEPHHLTYDWKTLATYALGIGAKRDELDFLYENTEGGQRVYPTFAVVPAMAPVFELLKKTGGDMEMVVHGGQGVRMIRPLPAQATLSTVGRLTAIYDLKRFAQVVLETETSADGEQICETSWSIIIRGAGGFGGPRPPSDKGPGIPKGKAPDWEVEHTTSPEQALLYRISGDANPLHADPAFAARVGFEQGPILHGLCTYGFVGRALLHAEAGGNPGRIKSFHAQFRKPVWPGDTLVTAGYRLEDGRIALSARVKERDEAVLAHAWAEVQG